MAGSVVPLPDGAALPVQRHPQNRKGIDEDLLHKVQRDNARVAPIDQSTPPPKQPGVGGLAMTPAEQQRAELSHLQAPPGAGLDWRPPPPPPLDEQLRREAAGMQRVQQAEARTQVDNPYTIEGARQNFAHDALLRRDPVTHELGVQQWDQMTPLQKAAAEFNAMLVDARASDREYHKQHDANYDPNVPGAQDKMQQQVDTYTKAYERHLGDPANEGLSSDFMNPDTLSLLEQLNINVPDATVQDFTSGRAMITDKDIAKYLAPGAEVPFGDQRGHLVQQLAHHTLNLERTLARGNKLLFDFTRSAAVSRRQAVTDFGGQPDVVDPITQRVTQEFNDWYNVLLASKTQDEAVAKMPGFLDHIASYGVEPTTFYDYVRTRSLADTQNGGKDVLKLIMPSGG